MESNLYPSDVILDIQKSMLEANKYLSESPSSRFNRMLLKRVKEEIENAKNSASLWISQNPDTHVYVYNAPMSMAIYNELSEDFLIQLEATTNVSIYSENGKRAIIRIILHF